MAKWKEFLVVASLLMASPGCNVLEDFGDTTTDEARFVEAKMLINKGLFSEAILQFEAMGEGFLAKPEVKVRYASAYAGRCGLDFLSFVNGLGNIGSDRLFQFLMKAFSGATTAKIDDCVMAQNLLLQISAMGSGRSIDENFLMAFVSLAKTGSILAAYADEDANDSPDAGFNACADADLPEAQVREVGASFVHIFSSLIAIGDQDDVADGALNNISAALTGISAIYDFCDDSPDGSGDCANTDPASFDATDLRAIRTLVRESDVIGLGTCTGDFAACACP